MSNDKKTVIVIGAGPAGLTAAYKLLKETDSKVIVIEETDKIGGISRTDEHNGNRMDIGGHRFFSKNEQVTNFWEELMPLQGSPSFDDIILGREKPLSEGGPDPEKEDNVMLLRTRVSRIYFLRKFFDYPISLKFDTFKNMGLSNTIKAGFGYISSCISKREEKSLEDFYINRFGKPLYSMFFEDYTEKLWGVHPSNISPDWGAQRVKGLSLTKAVSNMFKKAFGKKDGKVETSLIEQFYYPKKGPGQLWEKLADEVKALGGTIIMNTSVVKIRKNQNTIKSITVKQGNTVYDMKCDALFSSMPVKDLINAMSDAPENVREVSNALPYRDFITVGLLVKKLKIENKTNIKTLGNIVPDCWIYVQERDVKIGRIQIFNNWSPYMVKDAENTVWIGLEYFCNEGDEMWNMTDKEFIDLAIKEITKIGVIDKDDILDTNRIKIKKAYPAYFGSYSRFDEVRSFIDGVSNLYCMGRNGLHRYNNMDHSMLTAFVAAEAYKNGFGKENVWNVNAEEEYHEEKKS